MCDKKNVIKDEELEKANGGFSGAASFGAIDNKLNLNLNTTITNPNKIGVQLPGTNIQPSINVNIVTEKK